MELGTAVVELDGEGDVGVVLRDGDRRFSNCSVFTHLGLGIWNLIYSLLCSPLSPM